MSGFRFVVCNGIKHSRNEKLKRSVQHKVFEIPQAPISYSYYLFKLTGISWSLDFASQKFIKNGFYKFLKMYRKKKQDINYDKFRNENLVMLFI